MGLEDDIKTLGLSEEIFMELKHVYEEIADQNNKVGAIYEIGMMTNEGVTLYFAQPAPLKESCEAVYNEQRVYAETIDDLSRNLVAFHRSVPDSLKAIDFDGHHAFRLLPYSDQEFGEIAIMHNQPFLNPDNLTKEFVEDQDGSIVYAVVGVNNETLLQLTSLAGKYMMRVIKADNKLE